MNCRDLLELSKLIDLNNLKLLSTLYVYIYEKCLGRVSLSKKLGISERSARSVINYLKNKNFLIGTEYTCINKELIEKYNLNIETTVINEYTVSLIKILDSNLLNYINKHIVDFRDYIVVKTQNPYSIEIIGYFNGIEYVIPGLPKQLQSNYTKLLKNIVMIINTLFIIWRNYVKYYCEASIISSLYNACLNKLSINKNTLLKSKKH